jgi:hypothetical protein
MTKKEKGRVGMEKIYKNFPSLIISVLRDLYRFTVVKSTFTVCKLIALL